MKFLSLLSIGFTFLCFSCTENSGEKKMTFKVPEIKVDSSIVQVLAPNLKTDFLERVIEFREMRDSTKEQQVNKYETFASLFVEYAEMSKKIKQYSISDQKSITDAYDMLRDEANSLKIKLKNDMTSISKKEEARLDSADSKMNVYLPQVYK